MKDLARIVAGTVLVLVWTSGARAQFGAPFGGPQQFTGPPQPISPYLNMFSGRGNPAVNFFNFVMPFQQGQPQFSVNMPMQSMMTENSQLATDLTLDPAGPLPRPTGHITAFGNLGPYFNTTGSIGMANPRNRPMPTTITQPTRPTMGGTQR